MNEVQGKLSSFDPVACIKQIIENSGLTIDEIASRGHLNARHLHDALYGFGNAKLGIEEAAIICQVLKNSEFVRAWAKSIGRDVFTLPVPQHVSDDPVVHVRAAIGAFGPFLQLTAKIDSTDSRKARWFAQVLQTFGGYLDIALTLSDKTNVSANELRRLGELHMHFLQQCSEFPFPQTLLHPLAQAIANVGAATAAIQKFHESDEARAIQP